MIIYMNITIGQGQTTPVGRFFYFNIELLSLWSFEPRCEKTGIRGFRPGPTQIGLCSHRRQLEA